MRPLKKEDLGTGKGKLNVDKLLEMCVKEILAGNTLGIALPIDEFVQVLGATKSIHIPQYYNNTARRIVLEHDEFRDYDREHPATKGTKPNNCEINFWFSEDFVKRVLKKYRKKQ